MHTGHRIIRQGEIGDEFYAIRSGTVGVWIDDDNDDKIDTNNSNGIHGSSLSKKRSKVATLKAGDYFG